MFSIFQGDDLIGKSELEHGDPPMGVAFGRFVPTDAFTALRSTMKLGTVGTGKVDPDIRYLEDLSAKTVDETDLVCAGVAVIEYGDADDPFACEVHCLGIEHPPYGQLFPHHVQAYRDQYKKP